MGVILILLSSFCLVLSSYFGKISTNITEMSGTINSFSSFVLGTIVMVIYMYNKKRSFKAPDIKPILSRAIFSSLAIILLSGSIKYTTITNANMLNMIYPVFVILLSPFLLKESINKSTYYYLLFIMTGSYIVANPNLRNINWGDLLAIMSAVSGALSILYLKKALVENEGDLIIFYVMFIGMIISIPFIYKDIQRFEVEGVVPIFMSGLTGFLGQILITKGYKYVDSSTGALVSTSRIVIGLIIGYFALAEPLSLRIILGMILIILSLIGLSGYFKKE